MKESPHPRLSQPWVRRTWGLLVAAATAVAVFYLPFRFPSTVPVSQSSAYLAGAGNAPAEIGAALLSLAVALAAYSTTRHTLPQSPTTQPPRSWLGWAAGLHTLLLLVLGLGLVHNQEPFGEAQYFLTQLTKGLAGSPKLYVDIAFAYGPLLFHWPLLCIRALAPLGVPTSAAYVASLWAMQMAGLALLFRVVRALPLRASLQRFAFVLVALGALSPTLGPNYCLLRFMAAPAAAILVARQRSVARAAAAAAAAMLLTFEISAECGVALLGAASALAVLHLLRDGRAAWRWLALPLAALGAAAVFAWSVGAPAFRMIVNAGHGGYDLLLTPEPRTLILLAAAVGLAPLAAARAARANLQAGAPVVALYGAALGVLPVALGRADSVHEYFFGLPVALLSLVALQQTSARPGGWARVWLAALLLWTLGSQASNVRLYWPRLRAMARDARQQRHALPPPPVDVDALEAQLGGSRVFVQYPLPEPLLRQMADRRMLAPAFFAGFSSVWEQTSAERIVREMRTTGYALVDRDPMAEDETPLSGALARWQRLGLPYRQVHARFDPGLLLDRELLQHWQKVTDFSDTSLYRFVR